MRFPCRQKSCLTILKCALFVAFAACSAYADDLCLVQHPLIPPKAEFTGQCPNCGMTRNMWARTWMAFEDSTGRNEACSFHCLADTARKTGEKPQSTTTALYMSPEKMVPVDVAWFVVGSSAKGTMTANSKIAFPAKADAEAFQQSCGGKVLNFTETLALSEKELPKEKAMIMERRIKSGKIVEPVDNQDECSVCKMYPARYPQNRCQIHDSDKTVYHFCSTQCLFSFLKGPKPFVKKDVTPMMIWVTDYPSGSWIGAKTAYYVVGSTIQGPMGYEAPAFERKADALSFSSKEKGTVLSFPEVDIHKITPKE